MNKISLRNALILFLVSILVFLVFMYISYLRGEVAALESQKQNLLQELEKGRNALQQFKTKNASLRSCLRATHQRLDKSFKYLSTTENGLELLNSQLSVLKAQIIALAREKERISRENESLQAKLNLQEVPRVIQESEIKPAKEENKGFLVKEGKPAALANRVKIEVLPAAYKKP